MRVRVVWMSVVVAVLVATVVAFVTLGGSSQESVAQINRAAQRAMIQINAETGVLSREGIFVSADDLVPARRGMCVSVALYNPTAPNRAWMHSHYPGICPRIRQRSYARMTFKCTGARGRRTRVPDVVGLRADIASRRLVAAGFGLDCNSLTRGSAPGRFSPDNALIVTKVCTRFAARGAVVQLVVSGRLPGGFDIVEQTCHR